MRRQNESLGELLFKAPWWISAVLGILLFAALRWGVPLWSGSDQTKQTFANLVVGLSPAVLFVFAVFAAGSFWFSHFRRSLLDDQTGLESLRATPWKQFEFLVAEAFRRQGYQVEFSLNRGADGGVDLILRKEGHTSLVQCKQWKVFCVGASVVREMFGLMIAENADETIIVTSGKFTRDAQEFAEGKPIRLIDGPQLLALVQSVQSSPNITPTAEEVAAPVCPLCGKPMVMRTARRGNNVGNQFWGCPAYPDCRGIRNI